MQDNDEDMISVVRTSTQAAPLLRERNIGQSCNVSLNSVQSSVVVASVLRRLH